MRPNHVGFLVEDLDAMVDFYEKALGLVVSDSQRGDDWSIVFLTNDPEDHHQVVLITGRPPGAVSKHILNQVSFELDDLAELRALYLRVVALGCADIEPATHGNAWSVYFRDPEGNRLECFVDTPWYVSQPHFTLLDYTKPVDEIRADTEALVRADPSFQLASEWRAKMKTKIEEKLAARA